MDYRQSRFRQQASVRIAAQQPVLSLTTVALVWPRVLSPIPTISGQTRAISRSTTSTVVTLLVRFKEAPAATPARSRATTSRAMLMAGFTGRWRQTPGAASLSDLLSAHLIRQRPFSAVSDEALYSRSPDLGRHANRVMVIKPIWPLLPPAEAVPQRKCCPLSETQCRLGVPGDSGHRAIVRQLALRPQTARHRTSGIPRGLED